jgi:hypothetical protein
MLVFTSSWSEILFGHWEIPLSNIATEASLRDGGIRSRE